MKMLIQYLFTAVIMLLVLNGCAAKVASPPSAKPPSPVASGQTALPASQPALTPETDPWNKVMAAAQREGSATLYSYNFTGEVGLAVKRAFEGKYGVQLNIITGRGAEQVERLKTEKRTGAMVADFQEGSNVFVTNIKQAGMSANSSDLPVLKEKKDNWVIDPLSVDPEGYVISHSVNIWTTYINTKLIKTGEEPKSFQELTENKWKGKLLDYDPNISGAPYLSYLTAVNHGLFDMNLVRDMGKQDRILRAGSVDLGRDLATGIRPVLIWAPDSDVALLAKEGAPIKAIQMKEGAVASPIVATIIKDGPHPNAARLFLNWFISKEGQSVFDEAKALSSIRRDVPDFRPTQIQFQPTRIAVQTAKDSDEAAIKFRDKFFQTLWK